MGPIPGHGTQTTPSKLRVDVTLSNTVGPGSEVTWVDFKGREYVYEQGGFL